MPAEIVLYGTSACHLCEDAIAITLPLARSFGLNLREVDIAGNESLENTYGLRIPVISFNQVELNWPFDATEISAFLQSQKD